jgi:hypothetical protein
VAGLHWHCRHIQPGCRWGDLWQTLGVHTNDISMAMAQGHLHQYNNAKKSTRHYHKLRFGNGGTPALVYAMEKVCGPLREKRIMLFNDNSPSIGWVTRLASKQSLVAKHLVQALALQLKIQRACPLTPIHIEGKCNAISDVPSQLFGSNPA